LFEFGAAAGYLNPHCYDVALPDGYLEAFRRILSESFRAQAGADGRVDPVFNRFDVLAVKA